jgi:Tfp pilus assembly protein PilV
MTLIEAMIALIILSIISLGMISMMTATISVLHNNGNRTERLLDSQEVIEEAMDQEVSTPNATTSFNFNGTTISVVGEEITDGEITIFIPQ